MTIDNRQQLLGTINSQIKLNGVGAITGPILNNILDTTVNSVMFYAGVWSQYTNYSPLDVVLYNGVSYIALLTNVNLSPSANPTYWTPLVTASQNASGATGSVQYNNGFGGFSGSSNFTYDGTNLTTPAYIGNVNAASATSTGASTARTVSAHFGDVLSVKDFGAVGNGTTDDTAAIQAALNAAGPGKQVWLNAPGQYLINSANLNIPKGVQLCAGWQVPGTTNSSSSGGRPLDLSTLNGALILNSSYTITMQSGSSIRGVPIYRKGLVIPAADSSAFAGTAITVQGDDCYIGYSLVLGFNQLMTSTTQIRQKIEWVYGDNQNGIKIVYAYDTPYIHYCHMWPFCTYSATSTTASYLRTGAAFDIETSGLISMAHCFAFGYLVGYVLSGDGGPVLIDCQADCINNGAVGFAIGDGVTGDTSGKFIGCTAFGITGTTTSSAYQINLPVGDYVEFTSCSSTQTAGAYNIVSGDVKIIGGCMDTAINAITVAANTSIVTLDGVKALNISTATIYNPGGGGTIYVSPSCDFARGTSGGSISSTMVLYPVLSAAAVSIPEWNDVFRIIGTTDFGVLLNGWAGRKVTLWFATSLTVYSSTGAAAIRLDNNANFTTAVGSTLTLVHDGTQWYEMGRSY